jgi:hypothetical protein
MANFSASNNAGTHATITATYKTLVNVTAITAGHRGKLYDVMFGTLGTPADQSYEWDISRCTTVGTGSSTPVPAPLDPADSACTTVCNVDHSAEPTYTASTSLFYLATNQRASYRWVASPGSEMLWPVTNLNGLGLRTRSVSGGAATCSAQFLFQEQ